MANAKIPVAANSPWRSGFVPGVPRIAYDHLGEGPLLLFLHGIGGNRTNWHEQIPAFAQDFHAVAWDARGYGISDDYAGALDFGDFSQDIIRLLDHFGAERVHLCGLSMGGRIAQDFYQRHRERVVSLVLCDTFPGGNVRGERREEFLRLRLKPLREDGLEPSDIAMNVAKTLIGPSASPDNLHRLVESISALHKESYIKTLEETERYEPLARLDQFDVPTLLVFGSDDRLTTPEMGARMHEKIRGSRLCVIPGAGHLSNIEKPEEFNRVVLAFLREQRKRAASS